MSQENAPHSSLIPYRSPLFWLTLIVVLAALLRFVWLDTVPVGSDGDAAWFGFNALDWIDRGVRPYYVHEMFSPEPITVYLLGLTIPLVGISNLTTRVVSAMTGVAFVVLLYPAVWWLLADFPLQLRIRAGLLAALAGAISLHLIHVSRTGLQGSQVPLLVMLTLMVMFTAWAWARGGWWRWALAGASLALTQYVYLAGRVAPLVVVLWFVYTALAQSERFQRQWRGWVVMAAVAFILVLPNLILYATLPQAFAGRANAGTAFAGGLIWNYDTSRYGGPLGLMFQKLQRNASAVAVFWDGPYTSGLNQPILTPMLVLGLVYMLWLLVRKPRCIAFVWLWLAIPVMLVPDLIASINTQPHAMRQIGVLPFLFMLAAIGLASLWVRVEARINAPPGRAALAVGLLALVVLPSALDIYQYVAVLTPQRYADPETGWHLEQTDLDISRRLVSQPDAAYLIPFGEYERPALAWIVAGAFRDRRSAIMADGTLALPDLPDTITLMQPTDPHRPRHDGKPAEVDNRLWVLLYKGQAIFLPPVSPQVAGNLYCGYDRPTEVQYDGSETDIAFYCTIPTPESLFAPYTIPYPLNVTISDEVQLVGYDIADENLIPDKPFSVTLFWKALRPPADDYDVFVQLWNDAGESLALWQGAPYNGAYRMRIWRTDEIVPTHHWLMLPKDAAPGRYSLAVGLFDVLRERTLPASGNGIQPGTGILVLPDLRLMPPIAYPPLVSVVLAPYQWQFGDSLLLDGFLVRQDGEYLGILQSWEGKPGATLSVLLDWEVLQRPAADYSVFLHLTRSNDAPPVAQQDKLMGGILPTGAWRAGDDHPAQREFLELALPSDLPSGEYTLWMGQYNWQTGERLPVYQDGTELPDSRLKLGTIIINK